MFDVGDKVRNVRDGKIGIVVRVYEHGSIAVLESIKPTITCTHDSHKTLELIEKNSVQIYDERLQSK